LRVHFQLPGKTHHRDNSFNHSSPRSSSHESFTVRTEFHPKEKLFLTEDLQLFFVKRREKRGNLFKIDTCKPPGDERHKLQEQLPSNLNPLGLGFY
jgi:hypothetical protein